jgi:hypothetical protein
MAHMPNFNRDPAVASLREALASWEHLCASWTFILETAKSSGDPTRVIVAESKLAECAAELARLETLLSGPVWGTRRLPSAPAWTGEDRRRK